MSLKADLQTWADALKAYDSQSYAESLSLFTQIADNSKIHFNIGIIQATAGRHVEAVDSFELAIGADRYLAVAYFQAGYMRSNVTIDYEQLGLDFRLYSCEVLFNRGLASIYDGDFGGGMADLDAAAKGKQTAEHAVINDCINDQAQGYTVFSIPTGALFRPAEQKLKNLATKNYLGAAKLVAASDSHDTNTGFSGTSTPERKPERIGLLRSQTSAARLETSGDFEAKPLRRRPTLEALRAKSSMKVRSEPQQENEEQEHMKFPVPPPRPQAVTRGLTDPQPGAPEFHTPERPSAKNSALPTPPASDASLYGRISRSPTGKSVAPRLRIDPTDGDSSAPSPTTAYTTRQTSRQQTPSRDPTYSFINAYITGDENEPMPVPSLSQRPFPSGGVAVGIGISRGMAGEGEPDERVANWARQASRAPPPSSSPSISRMNSASEKGSTLGRNAQLGLAVGVGAHPPRQLSRSPSSALLRVKSPASQTLYFGDDGGTVLSSEMEMVKVRVKLRFKGDVRGTSIPAEIQLDEFAERVRLKFGSKSDLAMKYRDAEGTEISIVDSDDWETALDEAREAASGKAEGKLEIVLAE